MAQWQSTGCSSQRCLGFDSQQLPAFHLPHDIILTQDPRVLETVEVFRVPFRQMTYQKQFPKFLRHSIAEEDVLQEEIQSKIAKNDIEETSPKELGFCPQSYLCPSKISGVAKAGPGRVRARPKFVLLMCAQALVLLVQWLSVQQVPGQYQ